MSVLVLGYHAVEPGPPPLCTDPALFREHVDAIVESELPVLTVSELAEALRAKRLPERAVALTFDDGAASVARTAAPLLAEHGLRATIFCVAGYVGRHNDWPSHAPRFPRIELATADELAELARAGFELGSHGVEHAPLGEIAPEHARREIVDSKDVLEQLTSTPVRAFAYPYGAVPAADIRALVRDVYSCACALGSGPVRPTTDPYALPRIGVHYIARTATFRRALDGSLGPYLHARRLAGSVRRLLIPDHRRTAKTT